MPLHICLKRRPEQVLLVGGATRMPGVRQLVKNMSGLDARGFLVDPDEVS